jgi:hypothetical protein
MSAVGLIGRPNLFYLAVPVSSRELPEIGGERGRLSGGGDAVLVHVVVKATNQGLTLLARCSSGLATARVAGCTGAAS